MYLFVCLIMFVVVGQRLSGMEGWVGGGGNDIKHLAKRFFTCASVCSKNRRSALQ